MRDSGNGKAIKITPEELIFDQVVINQTYTQQLTLKNSLSAPVEINFKSSSTERLEVEPKSKKLAPFESCVVDVTIKVTKPFPAKTMKQKDTIFIKSDFFDQKINVTIIPSVNQNSGITPRDSSLGSSSRFNVTGKDSTSNLASRLTKKRDTSQEPAASTLIITRNQDSKDFSPRGSFQNYNNNNNIMPGLERELELKSSQLIDLADQLEKQEMETQAIMEQLNLETQKRRELEDKLYSSSNGVTSSDNGNSNEKYLKEVKSLLKEREPNLEQLMDLTLKKEREQQERKDAKILDILRAKDKHIEELQQKAVFQETDHGKLAQAFQEAKKRIKQLEEENEKQKQIIKQINDQVQQQQQQIQKFEQSNNATHLQQLEHDLTLAAESLNQLQEQLWQSEQALNQKMQNEAFYNEAIDRVKNQLLQKDNNLQSLEKDLAQLKEDKIRGEEQIQQLMVQLKQAHKENQSERNLNSQKLKSDGDIIERISKLQDDKSQLLDTLENQRNEQNQQNDRFRILIDRLNGIIPLGQNSSMQVKSPLIDQIELKFEEVARSIKDLSHDNSQMSQKLQQKSNELKDLESELNQIIEEKQLLESKVTIKKKVNSTQTQLDMHEMANVLTNYEKIRSKANNADDQVQKLQQDSKVYQNKIQQLQNELDKSKQEFNVIMRSQQANSQLAFNQSQDFNNSLQGSQQYHNNNQDELVSRLNAKITGMKINEEKLVQQINLMSSQLEENKSSNFQNNNNQLQSSVSQGQSSHKLIGLEERLGEYEIILMQQREQLVKLEEQNFNLNQENIQIQRSKHNEFEQLQSRLKNLNEINKKHEQMSTNRETRASTDTGLGFSISGKSNAADTEKLRQYAQQLELNNMGLKHSLEALQIEKDQVLNECQDTREQLTRAQRELIKLRQDLKLIGVGLNANDQQIQKISDQKAQIKQLEGLLLRAKLDYDKFSSNPRGVNSTSSTSRNKLEWSGQRLEDVLQTNESLRHENLKVVSTLMDLKEECTNKLHHLSSKYEMQRQKVKQENLNLQRKVETLTSQMGYMEKKELRLVGQLEELKLNSSAEIEDKEYRLKQVESLLIQKDETINEMEREIKQKDRSLQERQDQISVLIDNLENEHSGDELRQKVLNLSAELCSLKSMEAQQEKRANEMFHQLKLHEQNQQKDCKMIEHLKIDKQGLLVELDKANSNIYELDNKIQELDTNNNELQKECSDWKYKCERQELQLTMKEDSLHQLRDQLKRSEGQFKEQINRLRKDFSDKATNNTSNINNSADYQKNMTLAFKQSVQQLHLLLADYLQQNVSPSEQILVQDFEKTLIVASQTIEKLQFSLDKQEQMLSLLKNDYGAIAHNQILISNQEQLVANLSNLEIVLSNREDERERHTKQQEQSYSKIIKEQDHKIAYFEKQMSDLTDSNSQLEKQVASLKSQKEDLELSVLCFQQEVDSQRLAMERKAELTVDERYKSKHEAIKSYFDSNITKILLSQGGTSNKFLELGREICSLKIVIQGLENKLIVGQSDREGLESNLSRQKEQNQQYEVKIRELQAKLRKQQDNLKNNDLSVKIELEKKKNENLQLEKELAKLRETIDEKTRALNKLAGAGNTKNNSADVKDKIEDYDSQQKLARAQQEINELQEKIVEIRSQHILEIEGCKVQYDIDIAEAKRHLKEEKQQLDKKFRPGQAPGELIEKNDQLKHKVTEMRQALDTLTQENLILKKKVESEKHSSQNHLRELQAHKQALQELESTMIEGGGNNNAYSNNQSIHQMTNSQKPQIPIKQEGSKRSSSKGGSRKNAGLQFNRESTINDETNDQLANQSRFFQQDSSLNVSEMTSVNNPRLSQSIFGINNNQSGAPFAKQFMMNPPHIVKALINSKINELKANSKVADLVQVETNLRDNLKSLTIQLRELESLNKNKDHKEGSIDEEIYIKNKRLMELELENEDLKIQIAQSRITNINNDQIQSTFREQQNINIENVPTQDYSVLVETILSLSLQIAKQESNSQSNNYPSNTEFVEQAQRMVIKALADRLFQGRSHIDLQYMPTEENDKKVWYLELLEQQLDNSDQSIKTLQNFIKKLQIEISGNLQSAAQIKAASMDLAQNTKKTSEEIKAVGQIVGLIRHDTQSMMHQGINQHAQQQQQTLSKTAVNPFLDIIDPRATTNAQQQRSKNPQLESLQLNNEALQNQLTITEKVKKTLEQEIVQLKISHAQELQQISNQLSQSSYQRDSLLQNNEELHEKVLKLEQYLENLKQEISSLNISYENNQHVLEEKERERETLAKTKTSTSKHLQKLQQDMADWRKQTDENMKVKEKQVTELTQNNQALTQERDRLKAENGMLRKNQKERSKSDSEEVKKLDQQIDELKEQLDQERDSRRKEVEFWVTERATMREMIDQLESDKAGAGTIQREGGDQIAVANATEEQLKQIKKKSIKKLKVKDAEIKNKDKKVTDLESEIQKLKMTTIQADQKIRDIQTKLSECEDRERYYQQKIKELDLEKNLILAERNNAIQGNDLTAQQIQVELNSLRECFSKLKVERDSLLSEMESTAQKEREQEVLISKLSEDVASLESKLSSQVHEKSAQLQMLESKNSALLQDVRYLRQENEKIKERVKSADGSVLAQEKRLHEEDMRLQQEMHHSDTLKRQMAEQQQQLNRREQVVQELQSQIVLIESGRFKDIESLKAKLQDLKDQNNQVIALYETQIDYLRSKFLSDKKLTEQKTDQILNIGQREAVIKSLKKEVLQLKTSLTKAKAKNKELKSETQKSENTSINQNKGSNKVNTSGHSKTVNTSKQNASAVDDQEKAVAKIAEMLSSDEGFKGMLEQLQKTNDLVYKIVEYEATTSRMESLNKQYAQQIQDMQETNSHLTQQYEDLSKKELKESKIAKQTQNQQELSKQQKQEIKSLQNEIKQIKEEWLSPEDFKALQEQLREQQNQIKAANQEVQRKREVINTMKQQKEQTENEANQIMQNMEDLKGDNNKLQRLIKEHNKNLTAMKDLKQSNDYLKATEKRLKDEINSLNEKLKLIKVDLSRKDQLIKDYKDKLDAAQDDIGQSRDRTNEIERLKEMVKKSKLEAEIKENQVRAIRQKLEHTEEELEQLRSQSQSNIMSSQSNQQQMDQYMKTNKLKLKKYELYLKKSLEALKKIGKQLTNQNLRSAKKQKSHNGKQQNAGGVDNPLMLSELDRDMYKDSVNILGVSMDELAEFMNPGGINLSSSINDAKHNESNTFIAQMDRALEIPETLNQDIDQICNYCVKLISEIGAETEHFI